MSLRFAARLCGLKFASAGQTLCFKATFARGQTSIHRQTLATQWQHNGVGVRLVMMVNYFFQRVCTLTSANNDDNQPSLPDRRAFNFNALRIGPLQTLRHVHSKWKYMRFNGTIARRLCGTHQREHVANEIACWRHHFIGCTGLGPDNSSILHIQIL